METILFRKVFSHSIIKNNIFKQIHQIHNDNLKVKKTYKWNEVIKSRYILASYDYLQQLKEYYKLVDNSDHKKYNRKDTVLLNALKSNSLQTIKYILEELHYDYNSYGCYNRSECVHSGFDLLYIASHYCNIDIVKYIESLKNKNSNNSWNYIESFKISPLSKDINVIQYIYNKLVENKQIPIDDYVMKSAIKNSLEIGRLDMAEWLINQSTSQVNWNDIDYIKAAIKSSKLNVLQYCFNRASETNQTVEIEDILSDVAKYGSIDCLEWLLSIRKDAVITSTLMDIAAGNNQWKMVKWLYDNIQDDEFDLLSSLLDLASQDGQLDIIKMISQADNNQNPYLFSSEVLFGAARNGSLEILEWVHLNRKEVQWSPEVMDQAAMNNHLNVVKWLHENRNEGCTIDAMNVAAQNGHLEMVKWLHNHRKEGCTTNAVDNAAMGGHFEVVQWLISNRTEGCTANAIDLAAWEGNLELIKWLHFNTKGGCSVSAIDNASLSGNLELVKFLHINCTVGCTTIAIENAAYNGHINVIQWLSDNRTEGCTTNAMDNAARTGQLELVQWLHRNRTEGCTTSAIRYAAEFGHLDVVQWLHGNRTEGCTTDAMDEAAWNGHLSVIQWLHFNRTEGCTTSAMDNAARNGNFDVVKWLYFNRTEGCTIEALEDSRDRDYFDILKFLEEKYPDLILM